MKSVSYHATWFKCATCGTKVIVGDYYGPEARRLMHQHKCQEHAEGEIKNRWNQ